MALRVESGALGPPLYIYRMHRALFNELVDVFGKPPEPFVGLVA